MKRETWKVAVNGSSRGKETRLEISLFEYKFSIRYFILHLRYSLSYYEFIDRNLCNYS